MASLAERVKAKARALGFDLVGIAAARPAPHADVLADWLAHSYHGEMAYMARSAEARQDPRRIAADVRSVIVLGTRYVAPRLPAAIRDDPSRGLIAAYAWGPDYHDQIKPRLSELDAFLRRETGRTALARCYVDTGPILERDWAMLAGLGFIGRNTCLIHPSLGSWLFLSVVLAPEELEPDPAPELFFLPPAALRPMPVLADRPGKTAPNGGVIPRSVFCDEESPASVGEPVPYARPQDWLAVRPGIPRSRPPQLVPCAPVPGHRTGCQGRPVRVTAALARNDTGVVFSGPPAWRLAEGKVGTCGRCTRCLTACPTQTLVDAYMLDARRCISYLTIELRGPIPRELRSLVGHWIFGCDVCQSVCPWSGPRALSDPSSEDLARWAPPLLDLLVLNEAGFRQRFRGTAVMRTKRRGLLRNVCVAIGNGGDPMAVPALARSLRDPEPLIRGHAAWALGRIGGTSARDHLAQALEVETEESVAEELQLALQASSEG